MKTLFLDIETLPADIGDPETLKALEYLYERKVQKMSDDKELSFEDFVANTSFDGGFGRILCIALGEDEKEIVCHSSNETGVWDEKRVLEWFWKVVSKCDLLVGHNIFDFDMRFIYQRSVVLGVKPAKDISFARYRSSPMYDTMQEWNKWGYGGKLGLEHIALALGIPTPKTGIDGSEVASFFKEGKTQEICDYCKRDVKTTRAVYKKMVFQN